MNNDDQKNQKAAATQTDSNTKFSERFNNFILFIFSAECVYKKGHYGDLNFVICENVDGDSGGLTKFGVDKSGHPGVDIKNLTIDGAKNIYFKEWKNEEVENYPFPLGEVFYDSCVNAGLGRSRTFMKECGNDVKKFLQLRRSFYKRLAANNPKDQKFLNGWLNRITDVQKFLKIQT